MLANCAPVSLVARRSMPVIPFGPWLPDAAALNNPGSLSVVNAYPGLNGYKPVPAFTQQTNALGNRPRGAVSARDKDGNVKQYAGDVDKLYELSSGTWSDVSKVGGYSSGAEQRWEFLRWKNKMLATNLSDSPQQITFGASAFADLTTAFEGRHIGAVGNFVVFGNTVDATDGSVPNRVRWSAFNDETDYTVSATTLSDFRDLQTGGAVQGIVSGEFGVVVLERSTWRMSFVGAPVVFQFDEVLPGLGALSRGGIVSLAGTVYFLSDQGFVALSGGTQATFIGAGKVDQFVRDDLDIAFLDRVYAVADARAGRVLWAYPGAGNTGGRPNKILVYDRTLDEWSLIEEQVEILWRSSAEAVTLDAADEFADDIDAAGAPSLDSSIYKGGAPQFAAFDEEFKSGFFAGSPMTAVIDTREAELNVGRMTHLDAFRPVVDGGTVTAQIATRNRQSDSFTFGASLNQSSSGRFTTRANARYHRARLTLSDEWTDAIGIQIERDEARVGEKRG